MSCEHCEMRVQKAVLAIDGISAATASAESGTVTVELGSSDLLPSVKAAIEDAGYEVA